MSQETLIKEEIKVDVKDSFGGFKIISPDSIYYDSCDDAIREMTKEEVEKFDSLEDARKEFVKLVRRDYKENIQWVTSKFPDSRGHFFLNGVKVHWELESSYCGGMYHFDFHSYLKDNLHLAHTEYNYDYLEDNENSSSGRVPNLLTETGYRSFFTGDLDFYDTIEEALKDYIKNEIPKKTFDLSFGNEDSAPKRQLTLLEMQGGTNQ